MSWKAISSLAGAMIAMPAFAGTLSYDLLMVYGVEQMCSAPMSNACTTNYLDNLSFIYKIEGEGTIVQNGSSEFIRQDGRVFTATFFDGMIDRVNYLYQSPSHIEAFHAGRGFGSTMIRNYSLTGSLSYPDYGVTYHGIFSAATYDGRSLQAFVPEPSIWAMLIFGFGVIGAAMRSQIWPRQLKSAS